MPKVTELDILVEYFTVQLRPGRDFGLYPISVSVSHFLFAALAGCRVLEG